MSSCKSSVLLFTLVACTMVTLLLSAIPLTGAALTASTNNSSSFTCCNVYNTYCATCAAGQHCCGAGTWTPTCINPQTTSCCQWGQTSSNTCPVNGVCCGMGSTTDPTAQCCPAGTTCCSQLNFEFMLCCASNTTCTYSNWQPKCLPN